MVADEVVHPMYLLLAAGDAGSREQLAAQLAGRGDCVVAGMHAGSAGLEQAAAEADPDVIVWDLGDDPEPALRRLAAARTLRVPIVAIVQDDRDGIRALAAGAMGLLPRGTDADHIVLAAGAVLGGLLALDPAVARLPAGGADGDTPAGALTPREHDVLRLLAEGLGNKQIAERLGMTEHTAKFHVHTILGKLQTQSRTEAVVKAARLGLVAI
jgi:two-component system nitrate/nitrite response regulator NarL